MELFFNFLKIKIEFVTRISEELLKKLLLSRQTLNIGDFGIKTTNFGYLGLIQIKIEYGTDLDLTIFFMLNSARSSNLTCPGKVFS